MQRAKTSTWAAVSGGALTAPHDDALDPGEVRVCCHAAKTDRADQL